MTRPSLQLPPGAFELVGVRVAAHHDGGPLDQPQIALAELDALALGQLHQLLDRAMCEPGVGRMSKFEKLHDAWPKLKLICTASGMRAINS